MEAMPGHALAQQEKDGSQENYEQKPRDSQPN